MANWQREIHLKPEFEKCRNGEITVQDLAKVVSEKLNALDPFKEYEYIDEQRLDLAGEFESLSIDSTTTVEDFDQLMEQLYDWGDTSLEKHPNGKKVCWIGVLL